MDTVVITNLSAGPLAANYFSSVASGASKTVVLKTVDADDQYAAYQKCADVGGYVTVNGTLAAGSQAFTVTGTLAASTRSVTVDSTSGAYALDLMLLSAVPANTVLFIKFTKSASNNVTVTPNGAETINGAATLVLSSSGITRIQKSTATNWVTL
jgi:hypothetical protein